LAAVIMVTLLASASPAGAQPKVRRVAALSPVGSDVPVQDVFVRVLRDLGYVEGQNPRANEVLQ
jgi:hypothetical protein